MGGRSQTSRENAAETQTSRPLRASVCGSHSIGDSTKMPLETAALDRLNAVETPGRGV